LFENTVGGTFHLTKSNVKRVALAYSGGLDTSIIIPWLKENYDCEVIAIAADVGQGEELDGLREKAIATGAAEIFIEDLRHEFVTEYIFPTLRAGAVYEHKYLLGTSFARPVIAKKQVEIALQTNCDALAHGCTGKGNDQVRFELTFMALAPQLTVIAPWRDWDIVSREDAIDYANERQIPITASREKIYSRDRNIWQSPTRAAFWKIRPRSPRRRCTCSRHRRSPRLISPNM
jgi:argininosuccinate synthase